jgi:hypothetical protein
MRNSVNLKQTAYLPLSLSIYVDAKQTPQGVLVLLSDWAKLKAAVDPDSPFYKLMTKLTFIPFHERPLKEQSQVLDGKIREVEIANLKKGSFITYTNELCTSADLFINEYADRKELVRVDAKTGSIELVTKLD